MPDELSTDLVNYLILIKKNINDMSAVYKIIDPTNNESIQNLIDSLLLIINQEILLNIEALQNIITPPV